MGDKLSQRRSLLSERHGLRCSAPPLPHYRARRHGSNYSWALAVPRQPAGHVVIARRASWRGRRWPSRGVQGLCHWPLQVQPCRRPRFRFLRLVQQLKHSSSSNSKSVLLLVILSCRLTAEIYSLLFHQIFQDSRHRYWGMQIFWFLNSIFMVLKTEAEREIREW